MSESAKRLQMSVECREYWASYVTLGRCEQQFVLAEAFPEESARRHFLNNDNEKRNRMFCLECLKRSKVFSALARAWAAWRGVEQTAWQVGSATPNASGAI